MMSTNTKRLFSSKRVFTPAFPINFKNNKSYKVYSGTNTENYQSLSKIKLATVLISGFCIYSLI